MAAVVTETRAAGFVIFRRIVREVQYLLLKASYGDCHWSPPKGHVDPGENEYDTALRETEEEAGLKLSQLSIVKDFEKVIRYDVRGSPKKVTYWLAEVQPEESITLSSEHTDYSWAAIEEACQLVAYHNTQQVLRDCEVFLSSHATTES